MRADKNRLTLSGPVRASTGIARLNAIFAFVRLSRHDDI